MIVKKLKILRIGEVVLMTGYSLVGLLFAPGFTPELWPLIFLFAHCLFFVLAIYALNSYADYETDLNSERLHYASGVSKSKYLAIMAAMVALFTITAFVVQSRILIFSYSAFLLWGLYYLEPIRLKSKLFTGTLIHIICGCIHFHIGFSAYDLSGISSWAVSLYFGLMLGIGHLNHELLDLDDDLQAGIKTTTVRLGQQVTLKIRRLALVIASGYLLLLYMTGTMELLYFVPFFTATVFTAVTDLYSKYLDPRQFQILTRTLYAITGTSVFLILVIRALSI